jgi:uncharacterized membrane protein
VNRAWKGIWAVVASATFAVFFYRAWHSQGTDAQAYIMAGLRAWAGQNYYVSEATPFKYLPPIAFLFVPFSWMSLPTFNLTVFFTSWLAGAYLYKEAISRLGSLGALLLFALFLRFHNYDFLNLQINHWILLLLWGFLAHRRRHPWFSAFCFSLAAAFKLTPLMLLLPLLFLKRWQELARIGVFLCVLCAVPILFSPLGVGIYSEWYQLVKSTTPWPAPDFPIAQSVQGALWFLMSGRVEPHAFAMGMQLLVLLILGATLVVASKKRLGRNGLGESELLCAFLVLAVIFSPLAWKHLYLWLWPAIFLLVRDRRWKVIFAVGALMSIGPGLVSIFTKHWADRSYMTVAGALVIWAALLSTREPRMPDEAFQASRQN